MKNYIEEQKYQARCAAAIETLRLFVQDAKYQAKNSLALSTVELILSTVDKDKELSVITYENAPEETAYVS